MPCQCSPYPYVIPDGFSSENQKRWEVTEAYKHARPLVWNESSQVFQQLEARDEDDPDYYIVPDPIEIDGCGDPVCFDSIAPVGPICVGVKGEPFIVARRLCGTTKESDDFTMTTNNMFPDSLCGKLCDCPPILKPDN
jgi:hypothetical protein